MTDPVARRRATMSEISPASLLIPPTAVTTLLWATSTNPVETSAVVYAFFLLLIPWGSYLCWRQGLRDQLPMLAMVAGAYWVYFALALFWGERGFRVASSFAAIIPSESMVTGATWMALVGVVSLCLGMRTSVSIWVPAHLPDIVDHPVSWAYIRTVLIAGAIFGLRPGSIWLFGGDARQIMITLISVVPNVAFVLLLNRYLSGTSAPIDRVVLVACGLAHLVGGLASGWLGPTVAWGVTCGALVMLKRRNFPWVPVILTTLLLVFLQVGKNEFRNVYWAEGTDAGLIERVQFWVQESASRWSDALHASDRENALGLASQSLQRASLLSQVAHVLELTPSQVPFQEGETYKYLTITLIPRVLWPDKPSINDANRFYQVAYGLSTQKELGGVSIAVGSLAESYINFGWVGVIGVMLLIGMILGTYQRTFVASAQSSRLFLAIGLTLIPGFLAVESQLGQYLGGVLQQAALTVAVFLPIARRRGIAREPRSRRPSAVPALQA